MKEKREQAVLVYFPLDVWEKIEELTSRDAMDDDVLKDVFISNGEIEIAFNEGNAKLKSRKRTVRKCWLPDPVEEPSDVE